MDRFHRVPPHHLGATLGVFNAHMKEPFHYVMEHPAGELAPAGLFDVEHRTRKPARADNALRLVEMAYQVMECLWWSRAVSIDVTDGIGQGCQFKALDQRATFADRVGKFKRVDDG